MNIPRLVIAGTQSGVGKTSLTLGIVAALKRRGLRVQTFKVGPDYLDPTYLAIASGRPCYNLDGWMTGETYVRELFRRVCADADVALIEGAMGLFDGADPATLEGSAAEIAKWLDAPVVLISNAHGAGRSFAAMAHGFATFVPEIRVAGVIANRCGSDRHAGWLSASLSSASLPPLLGAVKRGALPELPSRHLGLVTADAKHFSQRLLDQLTDAVEASVSLDTMLQLAQGAPAVQNGASSLPPLRGECVGGRVRGYRWRSTPGYLSWNPSGSRESADKDHGNSRCSGPSGCSDKEDGNPSGFTCRLSVAMDEAFHFYYPDNLDALEKAGCELVFFSPVRDLGLPTGLDGIYIGGGYPEEYAQALSSNTSMLESIRQFAARGRVIYAECGGLMYLSQGIETVDGARHPMTGLVSAWTRMCPRRKSLGYVEAKLTQDSLWGNASDTLRGHEFHYSELMTLPDDCERAYSLQYRRSQQPLAEGFQRGSILASYAHLHFASHPRAVTHFVNRLKSSIP